MVLPGIKRSQTTLGPADDALDADGVNILDHAQAQTKAREWISEQLRAADGHGENSGKKLTVRDIVTAYMADYRRRGGKAADDAQTRIDALILPSLGSIEVAKLTATRISAWHASLAAKGARLRTRTGKAQRYRDPKDDPEAARKRRSTANRTLSILKAALNYAFRSPDFKSVTNDPWRSVEPFPEVDVAKVRYLAPDECRTLVSACDADLRSLVHAALLTGCRYGELAALRCHDFDEAAFTVTVRVSKAGKPRHVVLSDDGIAFFKAATADKPGDAPVFTRNGKPWGRSHQHRPIVDACKDAKISPPISFHILRHTYAVLLVRAGTPMPIIAANLGHADTRMTEKHYAHLAPSHVASVIREKMPALGIVAVEPVKN